MTKQQFTLEQKAGILADMIHSCYCSTSLFVENVGSRDKVKKALEKLNTVEEIKAFMHEYI